MNKRSLTFEIESRQGSSEGPLAYAGARRLLLGASIRLLGDRFRCGQPILQGDLLRLSQLADDARHAPNEACHV